ncbi:DUF3455 domain-containing protein [Paucibacter sp. APW11]|uniref:DUF3455 domain-containing protein n=1 Tax=Roseateles aquae TaxID=3077235 RepID=A0ABU3PE39_9BURK|nr:DUF3455 domain-containing protein [Paucibacter sp. APW11]MDT9000537.1 DUF3455 domain-containing protein [Paucibacter sp. APW11]
MSPRSGGLVLALTALCTACAMAVQPFEVPDAPLSLRAAADQIPLLKLLARGVQIYECAALKDQPGRYEWSFKAPEAELSDVNGRPAGKHYGGPTWEALDGSTVVGEVKARDPGSDPNAIPWLLLTAKSNTGNGVFSRVRSIQRLQTVGGKAPTEACGAERAGQQLRVPYTASYYLYANKP